MADGWRQKGKRHKGSLHKIWQRWRLREVNICGGGGRRNNQRGKEARLKSTKQAVLHSPGYRLLGLSEFFGAKSKEFGKIYHTSRRGAADRHRVALRHTNEIKVVHSICGGGKEITRGIANRTEAKFVTNERFHAG